MAVRCEGMRKSCTTLFRAQQDSDSAIQRSSSSHLHNMWWPFSSSATTIAAPAESAQRAQITPTSVPLREARNQCYAAKDAYFACLDAASILTPGHEVSKDGCLELKKTYEERCQKSWVCLSLYTLCEARKLRCEFIAGALLQHAPSPRGGATRNPGDSTRARGRVQAQIARRC